MALDKIIVLIFTTIFLVYGYTSFYEMDNLLPPVLKMNPVWPSTFPKFLSILGLIVCFLILINFEKTKSETEDNIIFKKIFSYNYKHALYLIIGMVLYALCLRPLGFIISTFLFLFLGSILLGERNYIKSLIIIIIAATSIWYLVHEILEIYMNPLPSYFKRF
jgi:putative tricarboxylic transport membrane protein